MRDESRNYVVAGAFVIAMLSGLVVAIAVLSGRTGATDPYHVHYDDVMGLSSGTQVLYAGFPVGSIDGISPVLQGGRQRFRVDLRIQRGWKIPDDSIAQVTASGLLSAVIVNVAAGSSAEFLDPGSEIPGANATNLFAVVASVAGEIEEVADEIAPLLASLSETAPGVIENLEMATQDLRTTLARMNELVGPTNTGRVGKILANVESASTNFDAVSTELRATQGRLDRIGAVIEGMLERNEVTLEHSLVDLHDSLESVSSRIVAISRNVESMTRNLNEFSLQLRQDPSVLIRGRSAGENDGR